MYAKGLIFQPDGLSASMFQQEHAIWEKGIKAFYTEKETTGLGSHVTYHNDSLGAVLPVHVSKCVNHQVADAAAKGRSTWRFTLPLHVYSAMDGSNCDGTCRSG